jgi:hypothetical protein
VPAAHPGVVQSPRSDDPRAGAAHRTIALKDRTAMRDASARVIEFGCRETDAPQDEFWGGSGQLRDISCNIL